jgi:DNA polymerase-3 subunit gamma/tau
MSYTVFALKWRPQTFDEIVGQGHIVTTLKSSIEKNRLAHAYLFSGPRGVGKTSTARILAKAFNCKEGPTVNPCQKCSSCLEINQSRSLDVIEIDGASNRGIDEIRTLRESVKFAPASGRFKIYIIDEVHMLTLEAFNALLKTLEEPPEFVKFIFATTQINKVIPTIRSRCQIFNFRRILAMEIVSQLEKIVSAEKIVVDKEVLFAIARASDGALRDAESVLDQLISFTKEKVSLQDVVSMLGLVEQETLFELTEKIIQKDARGALGLLGTIIDQGKDAGIFLISLIEHFRNLMIAKITKADPKLIDLPQDTCERLLRQAEAFELEEIFSTFNTLVNTQEMSKRLDSVYIPLEISLVKLAHDKKSSGFVPPQAHNPRDMSPLSKKENVPLADPPEQKEGNPPPVHNTGVPPLENIKGAWQNIINNLGRLKMSVATYLSEGSPVKMENNILTVSFPKNYSLHKESLEKKENKAMIEKVLFDSLQADIKTKFILSEQVAEKEDTFLKSALQAFGGRVIKEG